MARVIENVGTWLMWHCWRLTHPGAVVRQHLRVVTPDVYRTRESWARVTTSNDRELRVAFEALMKEAPRG